MNRSLSEAAQDVWWDLRVWLALSTPLLAHPPSFQLLHFQFPPINRRTFSAMITQQPQ